MRKYVLASLVLAFVVATPADAGKLRQKHADLYREVEAETGNIRGKPITADPTALRSDVIASIKKLRWIRESRKAQAAASLGSNIESGYAGGGGGGVPAELEAIAQCESGGNYRAVNPSSGAGGKYQFLPSTWRSLGYSGLPQDAPPAVQDEAARKLWAGGRGRGNWIC